MKTAGEWHKAAANFIHDELGRQLERDPKLRDDVDKLFQRVGLAYPFARKPPQLSAWKEQIRLARIEFTERLAVGACGLDRPCPVCRADIGVPCISLGENDLLAPDFMIASGQHAAIRGNKAPGRVAETAKRDVMHAQRRDPLASIATTEVVGAA